jgi:hypothetical protein
VLVARIIEKVLDESGSLSTYDLTELVISQIPPDKLQEALKEALPGLVARVRSRQNRSLFRETDPQPLPPAPVIPRTASLAAGGVRTASARTALLLEDRMLQMSIIGHGNRVVRLGKARLADLWAEISASESKGQTYLARAEIFREMQQEMARTKFATPTELPVESRHKYALRLRELLT